MPKIDDIGPYRIFFYASDHEEPPHVHIRKERATAKFWLDPVRLQRSKHFRDHELREIQKIVEFNKIRFLELWNEYFAD